MIGTILKMVISTPLNYHEVLLQKTIVLVADNILIEKLVKALWAFVHSNSLIPVFHTELFIFKPSGLILITLIINIT
jgi:hypothetical protein